MQWDRAAVLGGVSRRRRPRPQTCQPWPVRFSRISLGSVQPRQGGRWEGGSGWAPEDGTGWGRGTGWPCPRELTPGLPLPGRRPLPATPCRPRPAPVHRFPVIVAPGTKLESGPATLHLCNDILVVARDVPPAVAGQWKLSDLRRYGAVPNGFIFEGGTRCGFCKYMGRGLAGRAVTQSRPSHLQWPFWGLQQPEVSKCRRLAPSLDSALPTGGRGLGAASGDPPARSRCRAAWGRFRAWSQRIRAAQLGKKENGRVY